MRYNTVMATQNEHKNQEASSEAEYVLDRIIDETSEETVAKLASQVSVESERNRKGVIEARESNRQLSRLVIITADQRVLDTSSQQYVFYLSLAPYFDELHIIVSVPLRASKKIVKRHGKNMWLYTTGHIAWYRAPFSVYRVAKEQLVFTEGFRPDFIVSTDVFEAGLGAYFVAKKFERPLQMHIQTLFWKKTFLTKSKQNKWRVRIARFLLKRAISVRTETREQLEFIQQKYPRIPDIAELPHHYDIATIRATAAQSNPTDVFPQFKFVVLFVGELNTKSTLFRAIDAARNLLRSPSIALVVIGDGPLRLEFMNRAKILGVEKQVIFKSPDVDVVQHMQSADILICTDTDEQSEETVIKAAAIGLPLLIAKTQLREDLFTDGIDAFLCDPTDVTEFTQKLGKFINTNGLRTQFSTGAKSVIENRLQENPEVFRKAYRDSLEGVFLIGAPEQKTATND